MRTRRQQFSVNGQKQTKRSSLILSCQDFDHGCYYNNYVISSAKTHHVHTTTEFNFLLPQPTHTLNGHPTLVAISNVECQLVCFSGGHFATPPKSQLEQWHQWRVPIWW